MEWERQNFVTTTEAEAPVAMVLLPAAMNPTLDRARQTIHRTLSFINLSSVVAALF
jgi:hypothetical protein